MNPTVYTTQVIPYVRTVLQRASIALLSKEGWFAFPTESSDGRTNSQQAESQVADFLLTHPDLADTFVKKDTRKIVKKQARKEGHEEENNRAFGDIGINISRFGYEPFPCNIKIISEKNKASNNACGLTNLVGYTFSKKCNNHERVMSVLIDLDRSGYETQVPLLYGLIMLQKESKKCWTGTFDEVPTNRITPNPSNSLQIPFLEESERVSRTAAEYIMLLISKIVEYHRKKSVPLAMWHAHEASKTKKAE
jgi:hypothetical protein